MKTYVLTIEFNVTPDVEIGLLGFDYERYLNFFFVSDTDGLVAHDLDYDVLSASLLIEGGEA